MNADTIIILCTFQDVMQAELARSLLAANDIEAMISRDDCAGLEPHLSITGGVSLLVRETDADIAQEILENGVPADGSDEGILVEDGRNR